MLKKLSFSSSYQHQVHLESFRDHVYFWFLTIFYYRIVLIVGKPGIEIEQA